MNAKTLREQAEEARQAGQRDKYLELVRRAEQEEYNALQARHRAEVDEIKTEYPVGKYIPELHATITEIKDGCGTKSGWIEIYLGPDKRISPQELRRKIAEAHAATAVDEYFRKLKTPVSGRLYLGAYDETLNKLITYMDLDRIWTLEDWNDNNIGSFSETYSYAQTQAIKDGYTDAEAEEKGQEAEGEAMSEAYREYKGQIIRVLNYLFNFVDLEIEETKKGWYIVPLKGWHEAANKTAEIITGYGIFEYNTGKELKEVGPYKTYSQAVLNHLHWLKHAPEVYGSRAYWDLIR